MGTKETKSTSVDAITEDITDNNNVAPTENTAFGEEKTREDNNDTKIQTYYYSEPTPLAKRDGGRSVSVMVHQAADSVLDLVDAISAKLGSKVKEKFDELDKVLDPSYMRAVEDSRKIEALGPMMVEELIRAFEGTMTTIDKVSYSEQVNLLTGYKKLINEQINVIDSRIGMAERLKK